MSACPVHRAALVELARGRADDPALRAHTEGCTACAAILAEEAAITEALRRLAAADAGLAPSPAVEARLRDSIRGLAARRPRRRTALVYAGLAATVLVAAAAGAFLAGRAGRPAVPGQPAAAGVAEFAPLVYGEPLDGADVLHLTRIRVPRSALPSLGWPPLEEGPPIEAEVLVGQDGLARGIRFVADEGGRQR